jgi:hypothetical protein
MRLVGVALGLLAAGCGEDVLLARPETPPPMPGHPISLDKPDSSGTGTHDSGSGGGDQPAVPDDCAVGRAALRECGRVLAWGDEHIGSGTYWPESQPVWESLLAWLATANPECGTRPLHVRFEEEPTSGLAEALEAVGYDVSVGRVLGPGGASIPAAVGIIVATPHLGFGPFSDATGTALASWVERGGAVLTQVVGLGTCTAADDTCECPTANRVLAPLGLAYDCAREAPMGPVTEVTEHPALDGIAPADVPFRNGYWVTKVDDSASDVVAEVACD